MCISNHGVCNSVFVVSNVNRLFTSVQAFLYARHIIINETKHTKNLTLTLTEHSVQRARTKHDRLMKRKEIKREKNKSFFLFNFVKC